MKDKLKIQIIGWLLLIISLLIAGSMIGYDLTEEPTLVAQKINNPFNILGVYIGFYLMKLGFGYAALLIPIILATISFYLISNFSFNVARLLRFEILLLILLSVLLGFVSNVSYLSEFKEITQSLNYRILEEQVNNFQQKLISKFDKLNSSTNLFLENMRNQINYNEKLLESMSYKSVLNRGYSVTKNLKNKVIKSKKDMEHDTDIIIETSFAKISAEVKEIKDE